jgi:hypothetical protein
VRGSPQDLWRQMSVDASRCGLEAYREKIQPLALPSWSRCIFSVRCGRDAVRMSAGCLRGGGSSRCK